MSKKWLFIVICSLVCVWLLWVLYTKHQEFSDLQKRVAVYDHITQTIKLPNDFSKVDDGLASVSTKKYIQLMDELIQDIYVEEDALMRSNIFLLGKQYTSALEYLWNPTTASQWFNKWTIYLLKSYDELYHASEHNWFGDIEESIQAFEVASDLVSEQSWLYEKIQQNLVFAEFIEYILSYQYILEQFTIVSERLDAIITSMNSIDRVYKDVYIFLSVWEIEDELWVVCKEKILQDPTDIYDFSQLSITIQDIQQIVEKKIGVCLEDVVYCAKDIELLEDPVSEYLDALHIILDTVYETYMFVEDIVIKEDLDAFLSRCSQTVTNTGQWDVEELIESIESSFWEQDPTKDDDLEQEQDESEISWNADPSWSNYLLEDILKSQQQWLEGKKELEEDSYYDTLDLINEMFERFDGRLESVQSEK